MNTLFRLKGTELININQETVEVEILLNAKNPTIIIEPFVFSTVVHPITETQKNIFPPQSYISKRGAHLLRISGVTKNRMIQVEEYTLSPFQIETLKKIIEKKVPFKAYLLNGLPEQAQAGATHQKKIPLKKQINIFISDKLTFLRKYCRQEWARGFILKMINFFSIGLLTFTLGLLASIEGSGANNAVAADADILVDAKYENQAPNNRLFFEAIEALNKMIGPKTSFQSISIDFEGGVQMELLMETDKSNKIINSYIEQHLNNWLVTVVPVEGDTTPLNVYKIMAVYHVD